MDSEHRHELKQNELAEGLAHLPQLIKDNANFIIGLALIAVGLITWPMLSKKGEEKAIASQSAVAQSIQMLQSDLGAVFNAETPEAISDASNTLMVNADALLDAAGGIENPDLAALARIKAAQAYRTELLIRKDDADAETLQTQITKAQDAYQKALDGAVEPTIKGMATLGLGLCHEELGQTDEAAKLYQSIVDDETLAATVMPKQAQSRLDGLAENAEVFTFAPAPIVEAPAVEAPVIEAPAVEIPAPVVEEAEKPVETPAEDTK
ncbi:MAG: tetratricopeptide repeat protein [Planctomycetota bacterium]|jgi:tetratricopeptide (TPR) repeat protein